jgi:hypothetical protein
MQIWQTFLRALGQDETTAKQVLPSLLGAAARNQLPDCITTNCEGLDALMGKTLAAAMDGQVAEFAFLARVLATPGKDMRVHL